MARQYLASIAICTCLTGQVAIADDHQYELEGRANVLLGDAVPANDMLGIGLAGRYPLADGWFVSAALESYSFDFERPIEVVGLRQDPNVTVIDATSDSTVISAGIGRRHLFSSPHFAWFWELGLGAGFPNVSTETGPLSTGGTFTVVTDAGTEFHLLGKLGAAYHFSPHWLVNLTGRLEHHFIDYKVTEIGSGATGTISSHTPIGIHLGLAYAY